MHDVSSGLHTEKDSLPATLGAGCAAFSVSATPTCETRVRTAAHDKGEQHGRPGRKKRQEEEPAAARDEAETQGTTEAGQGVQALGRNHLSAIRRRRGSIARDAQLLRRQAVAQIKALNRREPDDKPYDQELVDAIMTDDARPSPESETTMRSPGNVRKRTASLHGSTTTGIPRHALSVSVRPSEHARGHTQQ